MLFVGRPADPPERVLCDRPLSLERRHDQHLGHLFVDDALEVTLSWGTPRGRLGP